MRRLPVVLHVVCRNDWSSAFLPGCACVHLPTMTPRVKPPHTLVSVLHWLWYCSATALSALANLTLLGKNTLPFPAFGNLNFVSPSHRRAYTSIPKSCPNIRFPHQQDFFPIRSVTKSSTARFSHENLVEKFKIFVQDFVPVRTALLRIWSRETVRPSRPASSCSFSTLKLDVVLTQGIPPAFRGDIHVFIYTAIRHRVSPEFIRPHNGVPMAFTTESPPAQGQQSSR